MAKRTYTFEEVTRGEFVGFLLFSGSILFALLLPWVVS